MLFSDTYLTIGKASTGTYRDRGSKFTAYAFPVRREEEIKAHIEALKKEHFNAVHHCYAYRLGADKLNFRANDDGEPSGSAGKPILGQLQSRDLTNVLVVVVRYFGGTLLGIPGLIAAYKGATIEALNATTIIEKKIMEHYSLLFPYSLMNDVMRVMKEKELEQYEQDFQLECRMNFAVRKSEADEIITRLRNFGCTCCFLREE